MATVPRQALVKIEETHEDVSERLFEQVTALRDELAAIARTVASYGEHALSDAQHGAAVLAREVQQQLPVVAREVGRQASLAGRAVRNDPLPTIVVLGTIALVSALIFRRDNR